MKEIIIIGAGGFGREIKMLIDQINFTKKKFNLLGFVDDSIEKGTIIHGIQVLGHISYLEGIRTEVNIVLAIGNPILRKNIFDKISKNKHLFFPTLIHPSAIIGDDNVNIGIGCIICAGCILTVDIKIQNFVILNLATTVGHDSVLMNFSSYMPSVNISGECNIEEYVYIGTGAKIINKVNVGRNTIIGAGTVVTKSLPSNCTAVGIPAKVVKINN
jgi:sugar O-acyltransferase (sialic acid O-acetyltransferase NeuD family)